MNNNLKKFYRGFPYSGLYVKKLYTIYHKGKDILLSFRPLDDEKKFVIFTLSDVLIYTRNFSIAPKHRKNLFIWDIIQPMVDLFMLARKLNYIVVIFANENNNVLENLKYYDIVPDLLYIYKNPRKVIERLGNEYYKLTNLKSLLSEPKKQGDIVLIVTTDEDIINMSKNVLKVPYNNTKGYEIKNGICIEF